MPLYCVFGCIAAKYHPDAALAASGLGGCVAAIFIAKGNKNKGSAFAP